MSDWWSTNVISVVAAWSLSDCIKANIGRVVIVATLQALLLRALLRALRIALDLIRQHQIKKLISSVQKQASLVRGLICLLITCSRSPRFGHSCDTSKFRRRKKQANPKIEFHDKESFSLLKTERSPTKVLRWYSKIDSRLWHWSNCSSYFDLSVCWVGNS